MIPGMLPQPRSLGQDQPGPAGGSLQGPEQEIRVSGENSMTLALGNHLSWNGSELSMEAGFQLQVKGREGEQHPRALPALQERGALWKELEH